MPQVSVIVPVYNVEKYIHRCVDSILDQTFRDFELILVDDGSPDNCGAICDEYAAKDSRVRVIHQANGGLSAARNAGIDWAFANSNSEWLTFIDSDDWVHLDYLKCLYEAVITYGVLLSQCGAQPVRTESVENNNGAPIFRLVSPSEIFGHSGAGVAMRKLIHKSLIKDVRFQLGKLHEDDYTTYKFVFATEKVVDIQNADFYYYRIREDSIMHSSYSLRRLDAIQASDDQLTFFKKNHIRDMELYVAKMFIGNIVGQYKNCKKLDFKNKTKTLQWLRRKLVGLLWRYGRVLQLSPKNAPAVYETAFPLAMWCYWTFKVIIRKIKRCL